MTRQEAEKLFNEYKSQGKVCLDLMFKGQVVPFFKEEVTIMEFDNSCFHYDWNGRDIVDYTKQAILSLGLLAGIETVKTAPQKLSKYCFVSTVKVERKLGDGTVAPEEADYEFDAEIKFDIEEANDIIKAGQKYQNNDDGDAKNNAKKVKRMAELAVHGRSRADTGAQKRAIVKLLGLPSPQKKDKGRYMMLGAFAFVSKVVPNLDNPESRNLYLNRAFGMDNPLLPSSATDTIHTTVECEVVSTPEPQQPAQPEEQPEVQDAPQDEYINKLANINDMGTAHGNEPVMAITGYYLANLNLLPQIHKAIDDYFASTDNIGKMSAILKMYEKHPKVKTHTVAGAPVVNMFVSAVRDKNAVSIKGYIKDALQVIRA